MRRESCDSLSARRPTARHCGRRGGNPTSCVSVRLCIHLHMDFEWDPQKARSNFAKHAIEFADAIGVLEDPYALTMLDPHPSEER